MIRQSLLVRSLLSACAVLSVAATALPAQAALLTIPSQAQSQEGTTSGTFQALSGLTSQQLFRAADMPGLAVGDVISGLTLRLDGGATVAYPSTSLTWSRFDIAIGRGVSTLTTTLANNFVGGATSVRSGALTMAPGFFSAGSSPNGFGDLIAFSTPYVYTGGDLLIELRTVAPSEPLTIDTLEAPQTNGQSVFGLGASATSADFGPFNHNWAMQISAAPVPEPASALLLLLGASVLLVRGRRKAA